MSTLGFLTAQFALCRSIFSSLLTYLSLLVYPHERMRAPTCPFRRQHGANVRPTRRLAGTFALRIWIHGPRPNKAALPSALRKLAGEPRPPLRLHTCVPTLSSSGLSTILLILRLCLPPLCFLGTARIVLDVSVASVCAPRPNVRGNVFYTV